MYFTNLVRFDLPFDDLNQSTSTTLNATRASKAPMMQLEMQQQQFPGKYPAHRLCLRNIHRIH